MSLQHILLGLLDEQPSSGYELNKRLQDVGQHFWVTEQSQVYRALYKMLNLNYVEYETVIQENSPNKKVYQLTQAGKQALEQWLRQPIERNQPLQIWLAQIYLGASLTSEEITQLIEARIDEVDNKLEWALQRLDNEAGQTPRMTEIRRITIEYHINMLENEREWLIGMRDRIQAL